MSRTHLTASFGAETGIFSSENFEARGGIAVATSTRDEKFAAEKKPFMGERRR